MVINVTQLNNYICHLLETDGILDDISVRGEVTNLKQAKNGWYFSLKDENAAIDCFCYANTPTLPVAGALVVADGGVKFWAKSGRVSMFVRKLTDTTNSGEAYLRFLQLKEKLQKEGLFDRPKKPVPACCKTIGVVTSATGAVIHDIWNVVHRRQPFSNIVLFPVKVQGQGAEEEIAQGVQHFSASQVDVVIVGRGGGSNEDLSAFNAECVVRAVAGCAKPVVSAVGHGVDFTLCDFAADKRAVTPSEAAEFVTLDAAAEKRRILSQLNSCLGTLQRRLQGARSSTISAVKSISAQMSAEVRHRKTVVESLLVSDAKNIKNRIDLLTMRTNNALAHVSAANPANLLKRGFAWVHGQGQRVTSVTQVHSGQQLCVTLQDGKIQTIVEEVEHGETGRKD